MTEISPMRRRMIEDMTVRNLLPATRSGESVASSIPRFRDKQARTFGRLSEKFDPIVRRLVGAGAKGRVMLSGNGIEANANMSGDRTTAAIDPA